MLAFEDCAVDGIAETDMTAVFILRVTSDDLVARSRVFREFVFPAGVT
ncbi:hypothetical protein [Paracoccus salsus]|nr:hypothetical protein [Paracoccus salsus]MCF3973205.1 hypothetical protein [Paracoccus salsus]